MVRSELRPDAVVGSGRITASPGSPDAVIGSERITASPSSVVIGSGRYYGLAEFGRGSPDAVIGSRRWCGRRMPQLVRSELRLDAVVGSGRITASPGSPDAVTGAKRITARAVRLRFAECRNWFGSWFAGCRNSFGANYGLAEFGRGSPDAVIGSGRGSPDAVIGSERITACT